MLLYRKIIPGLLLLAMLTGCNAPADPAALQHPINQRIVNAQCVTLETISVNGETIPAVSLQKAVDTFRQYVAGEVRVVQGKPVTVPMDKDGMITYKQIWEILKSRQYNGPSNIAIVYIPEQTGTDNRAAYYFHPEGTEARQYIVYQTKRVKQMAAGALLSEETCHQLVLAHELCHSFWVPCDRNRSWLNHHCTHSDCLLYATVDLRSIGTALLRLQPPLDLCPACQAEIRQAQLVAKGKRIPLDQPYDMLTYYDDLAQLNPDNPRVFDWRMKYHYVCKQYDLAIADLTRMIELEPDNLQYYMNRAAMCKSKGDIAAAEKDIHEIANRLGTNANHLNQFAWLLATAPDMSFRNGKIAVETATKACTLDGWDKSYLIDTLAAAYAEQGLFDKALEYQTQAMEKDTKKQFSEAYQKRLELYRQKKPYHCPVP